jgi:hypothetical protein
MNNNLKEKMKESIYSVLPITVVGTLASYRYRKTAKSNFDAFFCWFRSFNPDLIGSREDSS